MKLFLDISGGRGKRWFYDVVWDSNVACDIKTYVRREGGGGSLLDPPSTFPVPGAREVGGWATKLPFYGGVAMSLSPPHSPPPLSSSMTALEAAELEKKPSKCVKYPTTTTTTKGDPKTASGHFAL